MQKRAFDKIKTLILSKICLLSVTSCPQGIANLFCDT